MPDGSSVEVGEPGTEAAWGPIKDRYIDGVGKPAEKTKEQAIVGAENIGAEVLWCAGGL